MKNKNEYDAFLEGSEQELEEKKDNAKKQAPPKKTKHVVGRVSGTHVYTCYFVDGIGYGAKFVKEEKFKNLKVGDEILL